MPNDEQEKCVFPDCDKPVEVHAHGTLNGEPHTEEYCSRHWNGIKYFGPKWQFPNTAGVSA